jgi:CheY-like chemotaxis protein
LQTGGILIGAAKFPFYMSKKRVDHSANLWYDHYAAVKFAEDPVVTSRRRCSIAIRAKGMPLKSLGTILVVDDEPPIVEFMKEALVDEGYIVSSATDGDRAIAMAIAQRPNLILCDLHMPGVTGLSFVECIQRYGLADIPVVIMTADARAAQELSDNSFAACLLKPFDLTDLFDCVVRYIHSPSDRDAVN